ncbi:52 kDa repressor of the inhibitor of the protein kinase-like [Uloborus diversus]|uniref:52 kDa repressor of the inhibitor of the protein kinase-like n=1 Tax=Uloborus diversus TaxID=327109 RepID=UPI0024096B00|nr:52 kDa repressor of the inhibitor of the protein kinase-like [Uloborus diversus]
MEPIPGSSVSHVGLLIDARKASIIEQNLKRLKPIVKTVLFCAHNNLPLRGHRDDGNLNSREEQENALRGNQGVFKSLLAFRIHAGDEDLKTHLTTCRKNSTHISKTIQNDIIECIGDYIRSEITSSIQKAKYFSIICDETTDESKKEQLTFCVRYVDIDSFTTREDFLGFVELKATTGLSIKSAIDEELTKLNLSYKYLCGQGYDGASNMSGPFKGVQALISEEQPLAIYTHCFSHSLNLCITKSCQIPVIRNVMGTVETVSVFLSASAHRTNALIDVVEKQDFSETKKKRLKALCPTRRVERHDSLITFKELLVPVVTVLESLHTTASSEASTKAYMLNASIKRSEFIVGVEISVYCLSLTLRLSQQLQSPKQDLSSALANVSQVLDTFRSVRQNAELEFQTIYKNCLEIAEELDLELEIPRSGKRKSARDCTPPENPEVYFRRTVFLPLIDHFISEIDCRFSRDFLGVLPLEGLIPSNLSRYTDKNIITAAEKYRNFTDELGSLSLLLAEIKMWRNKWLPICGPPTTAIGALKELDPSFFPSIAVLLQIFATIPVTTSTPERSFSTLKRIKTYLRSTMGEVRLNGLALANVARDRDVSVDKIIELFCKSKKRRMCLENWEHVK